MNKHVFKWILMAGVVLGLSWSVTSCKDDDKMTPEERAEKETAEQAEKSSKFWNVVGQLVGTMQADDNYSSKTFEPTIGEPAGSGSFVRMVVTDDAASAANRFSQIVGLEDGTVSSETANYTWNDPEVGTLTYTKSNDGQSLATVDVNIKQVPHLQKIIFLTRQQKGDNANYTTCYYRFGDVISRTNEDGIKEFWVCVRPSFEPEGKGKSHWITLSPLPSKYIFAYTSKTNDVTYTLPKNLGTNREHMQNLAEMVYAMTHPYDWYKNIKDNPYKNIFNKGVPMFNDFDKSLIEYHGQQFWNRVGTNWEETKVKLSNGSEVSLWEAVFGDTRQNMRSSITENGIFLICGSYSWNTTFSNSPTLYEYAYKNGRDELSNAHIETYLKPSAKVIYKNEPQKDIKLSIAVDYTETHPYLENPQFFGNIYRHYIIRHATGEELSALSNTVYTTKRAISDFTEEYCYNSKYKKNLDDTPEKDEDIQDEIGTGTISNPVPGNILGADGNFYKTVDIANKKSRAVAIVAYTTSDGTIETDTDYTGLAISIKPINSVKWGVDFNCGLANANSFAQMGQTLNGISCTEILASGCGKEHEHPAAKACADYKPKVGTEGLQTFTFSNWFLPSVGQWMLACKGFGITWDEQGIKNAGSKEAAQKLLDASQVAYTTYTADAWTSTPYIIDNNVFCFSFNYNHINPSKYISMTLRVVPFIAFKKKG